MSSTANPPSDPRVLTVERFFSAPRDRVYKVWTDPRYVGLWWGVRDTTIELREWDVRPGGRWQLVMRTLSGREFLNGGLFLEVIPEQRLVHTDEALSGPLSGLAAPRQILCTTCFEDDGAGTRLRLTCRFQSVAHRELVAATGFAGGA